MVSLSTESRNRFSGHVPEAQAVANMRRIRFQVRLLAEKIEEICPEGRERATALTQLTFVMMSANSAIVQGYPIDPAELIA